jgi:hypothetical protein
LSATMLANADRITPLYLSKVDIVRNVFATARECEGTLGATALLLAAFAICAERRHRGLLVLLASYVATTIAFNLVVFRLPGAGSAYLHSAIPALALLLGPSAPRIVELATTRATRSLLAIAAVAIQLIDRPSLAYERPRPNGSRIAAAYIAQHSRASAGVLAETVAIDFYSDHPVRAVAFTYPREVILESLAGTNPDDISYVVIDGSGSPKNIDPIRQQWNTLLGEHFEVVAAGAPGLNVYRRIGLR